MPHTDEEINRMKSKELHITNISFVCAIMVIALHSYGIKYLFNEADHFSILGGYVISYVSHGLATVAVPFFFFVSGYLLFRNVETIERLLEKLKRRIKNLIIPYVCWNALYFVFYVVSSKSPVRIVPVQMDYSVCGIIEGIFFHKYCFNLWFLLNLIVFTYICSVPMFYLLRTKWVWLIWSLIVCSTLWRDLSINIVMTENEISLFSMSHFVYWMLGVVWSRSKKVYSDNKLCMVGYLLLSFAVMYVKDTGDFTTIECILVLLNMICFLKSAKLWIDRIRVPKYNMNMILYGGAGLLQIFYTKIIGIIVSLFKLPTFTIVPLYLAEVILVTLISYYMGTFIKLRFKFVYSLLAGNR